ncbi:hypothetical protein AB0N07_01975 [Streptomyces sp. NPDC051172]|uniref:hypothetical protein n=1 Tax=Streptomyces sp. NPDC051172 TaxID=3155796 RepID=UPI003418F3A1
MALGSAASAAFGLPYGTARLGYGSLFTRDAERGCGQVHRAPGCDGLPVDAQLTDYAAGFSALRSIRWGFEPFSRA